MSALVLIIFGLLLGIYFYRRKAPMTIKDWFLSLAVILVCIIIVSGFQNVDAIVQGLKDGAESGK